MVDPPRSVARPPAKSLLAGASLAVLAFVGIGVAAVNVASPRTTPTGEPPVLAGRQLWGSCAAGFYARRADLIVLTSSAHCAGEGTTAYGPDGRTVRGVFGPGAVLEPCAHEGHTCRPSDINYLVVAPDQIPWGRLNVVDMGEGGERTLEPRVAPLSCSDIGVGDVVEINGRDIYRKGTVAETGEYLHDPAADGDYFPCMIAAADVQVGVGDSGGAVLVRGLPAGATSRSFDGALGFTPLAEGLDALGLDLCTTPDCGLTRPTSSPAGSSAGRPSAHGTVGRTIAVHRGAAACPNRLPRPTGPSAASWAAPVGPRSSSTRAATASGFRRWAGRSRSSRSPRPPLTRWKPSSAHRWFHFG